MTTQTIKSISREPIFGGVPYGNEASHKFNWATDATGKLIGTDQTPAVAVAIGDVVRFGILRAGFEIHDALLIVGVAATAASTVKIGFAYVDGVDDSAFPQNDAYFLNVGQSINAAGRTLMNNVAAVPQTLNKDVYLIATYAGAAQAKASNLFLLVRGVDRGPK